MDPVTLEVVAHFTRQNIIVLYNQNAFAGDIVGPAIFIETHATPELPRATR
jgi:hypothetical protein